MKFSLTAMIMAAAIAVGTPTLVSSNLFDTDHKSKTPSMIVVQIKYENQSEVQAIANEYDVIDIDTTANFISVLVSSDEKAALEKQYGSVMVDKAATAELQASVDKVTNAAANADEAAAAGSYATIPGYSCYRTVEGTYDTAVDIVAQYPNLASWTDIGDSWEKTQGLGGYDIYALRLTSDIGNVALGAKPVFFANCAIHAREYATAELCTRFAETLVQGYGNDADITVLLDHHEVHLILQTNPDGRKKAEAGVLWRKNSNRSYCGTTSSSRGADLNRNFPFKWGGPGASSKPCDETYRGASAESEPESNAVLNYLRGLFPVNQRGVNPADSDPTPNDATGVALDIHSYGELVLYPPGYTTTPTGNHGQFVTLGRKLSFFNNYMPQTAMDLYVTTGTTTDTYYYNFGVAGICFEIGTAFFQDCTTFQNTILPKNLPSLLYAAKVARTPFMTPAGPDVINLRLSPSNSVIQGNSITLTASIDDTRYSTRNGVESSQNIASAKMYIDAAPWEAGATPIALLASDGSFNGKLEGVTGTIDTISMTPGKHTVYVVGTDSNGNKGAYSAIFLEVHSAGTCVNAGPKTGLACTSENECCALRRSLQNCVGVGGDCKRSACCPGSTCVAQGRKKICVSQTTSPTASPPLCKCVV